MAPGNLEGVGRSCSHAGPSLWVFGIGFGIRDSVSGRIRDSVSGRIRFRLEASSCGCFGVLPGTRTRAPPPSGRARYGRAPSCGPREGESMTRPKTPAAGLPHHRCGRRCRRTLRERPRIRGAREICCGYDTRGEFPHATRRARSEALGRAGPGGAYSVIRRRVPDTTLRHTLCSVEPQAAQPLHAVIRAAQKRGALEPDQLPFGVVALDGKDTSLPSSDDWFAQRQPPPPKTPRWSAFERVGGCEDPERALDRHSQSERSRLVRPRREQSRFPSCSRDVRGGRRYPLAMGLRY